MTARLCLALTAALLCAGCASLPRPQVDWSHYAHGLQGRVDHLVGKADCDGLHKVARLARHQHTVDVNLEQYVRAAEKKAGCRHR